MQETETKHKGGRPRIEPHKCEICGYTTKQTTALRNHYLAQHATEAERVERYNFYCHVCKVGFMSPKSMENHQNTKGHKRRAD